MTWLLAFGGIWFVVWLLEQLASSSGYRSNETSTPPSSRTSQQRGSASAYRPRPSGRSSGSIKFKDAATLRPGGGGGTDEFDLKGLRDAFTGAQLDRALGLFRCQTCQVYYHAESYEVIQSENAGRCVACSNTTIVAISGSAAPGRNFDPDVITLQNFRQHFGRVVTFEGRVLEVKRSRRGTDFAVMFEPKSWGSGFKLVFFRGAVRKVGGPGFVQGLAGKTVRVRGLLINHSKWGPEIIISERSMILGVR